MKRNLFCKSTFNRGQKLITLSLLSFILSLAASILVASHDLGKGFFDHGVAAPVSNDRGVVATVDGNGRNVVSEPLIYLIIMIVMEIRITRI